MLRQFAGVQDKGRLNAYLSHVIADNGCDPVPLVPAA